VWPDGCTIIDAQVEPDLNMKPRRESGDVMFKSADEAL